jgi:hypothetical protein
MSPFEGCRERIVASGLLGYDVVSSCGLGGRQATLVLRNVVTAPRHNPQDCKRCIHLRENTSSQTVSHGLVGLWSRPVLLSFKVPNEQFFLGTTFQLLCSFLRSCTCYSGGMSVRGTSHLSQEYFTKKCLLEGVNFRGNMCFKPAGSDFSKISSPRQRRMFLVVSVVLAWANACLSIRTQPLLKQFAEGETVIRKWNSSQKYVKLSFTPRPTKCRVRDEAPNLGPRVW